MNRKTNTAKRETRNAGPCNLDSAFQTGKKRANAPERAVPFLWRRRGSGRSKGSEVGTNRAESSGPQTFLRTFYPTSKKKPWLLKRYSTDHIHSHLRNKHSNWLEGKLLKKSSMDRALLLLLLRLVMLKLRSLPSYSRTHVRGLRCGGSYACESPSARSKVSTLAILSSSCTLA